jgi:dipeptide/tripeptide permease
MTGTEAPRAGWRFPKAFWSANVVELFERAAHYAMFISITLYLTNVVGFDDVDAAWLSGFFTAGLYFLPPFTGAFADSIGFRRAILLAFALLTFGYAALGALPYKAVVIPAIVVLMFGGSFIKSIITGTVAKTSTAQTRARAFSIFYGMVNVGAFSGKSIAYPLRIELGVEYVNYFSAAMSFVALLTVFLFYRGLDVRGEGKGLAETWRAFLRVVTNVRLLALIVIVAGFWMIQQQMYATMPKYVLRTVGPQAAPEWIANVNPLVVVTCVVLITAVTKRWKAITAVNVGMVLMPISALLMASAAVLERIAGPSVEILPGLAAHPVTVTLIAGIVVQGLAECFISPRYLEFFSLQAPKGEEGLYLGFGHLHSFISAILGFGISGYLLARYCPDPRTVAPEALPTAYADAHVIWYYFAAIGLFAAVALFVYTRLAALRDARAPSSEGTP